MSRRRIEVGMCFVWGREDGEVLEKVEREESFRVIREGGSVFSVE